MHVAEKALLFLLDHVRKHGNVQDSEKAAQHHSAVSEVSSNMAQGTSITINTMDAASFNDNSGAIVDAVNKELNAGKKIEFL